MFLIFDFFFDSFGSQSFTRRLISGMSDSLDTMGIRNRRLLWLENCTASDKHANSWLSVSVALMIPLTNLRGHPVVNV